MRKFIALVASLMLFLSASAAAAAETVKGVVKKVDKKASTITFSREGTKDEQVLTVDKAVSLNKLRPYTKAEVTLDGDVVKEIKTMGSAGGY
jgi:Cu/Ag efflux protein CusF